ncbi:hypothetical protein MRB53_017841 [Persea americana]|uniref:Uncharacterized protein n=1 Tax=Persea americana TaxID=3435 RepID=A0ACC2M7L7_PERAE|nr:hypothetical protein MRB53_017841 [Persea americana]
MSDSTPISPVAASIRSDDPAWAYGSVDPTNNKHVICRFCNKVIKGGRITRLKEHLGGVKGDIAPCKNMPGDIKWQMERVVLEGKKDRAKKRQLNEENGNPYGTPKGDEDDNDVEVEEVGPFTNPITPTSTSRKGKELVSQISTQNKRRGVSNTSQSPMSNFFAPRTSPGSQPGIKSALASKELKDAADLAVGRFWFDANLPFNAAKSKFCQAMADGIAAVGPSYKMPSYHDLRGKILGKIVLEVNAFMEHYKSCWSETGDMLKRTGNAASNPISLENINILADWVTEEAPLLTIEDVNGWTAMEQPTQVQEGIPDFDGGDEIGGPIGEDLGANEDDDHYYNDA